MRRIEISSVVLLLCSCVLGATVFREQVAQAAQAILPVKVTNTAAEAVPVTGTVSVNGAVQVSSPTTLPYQKTIHFNQSETTCTQFVCEVDFPAVPAGKRLVVTFASAVYGLNPGGTGASVELGINSSFSQPSILLPAQRTGFDTYLASAPVTFYVNGGDTPTMGLQGQYVQPASLTASATIVGYLVPMS
jgi:hypothetical protein